jgi:hypothetical protein
MAMMWYIHEGHTANEAYNWILQYPISDPYDYQQQCATDYYNWLQQQSTSAPTSEHFIAANAAVAFGAFVTIIGLLIYLTKRKS